MKRCMLMLLAVMLSAALLVGCGENGKKPAGTSTPGVELGTESGVESCEKHGSHKFTEMNSDAAFLAQEATCVRLEAYYYSCECGAVGTEIFEVGELGYHSFSEVVSSVAATCTNDGSVLMKCANCDVTITVPGDKATGHSWSGDVCSSCGIGGVSLQNYANRVLTDTQLASLKNTDLETLRAEISTIGDAVAFLEQFTPNGFSGFAEEINLNVDFLFDLHTRPEATTPQTYAAFAAWCITDDYEGIQYIVCVADKVFCRVSPALALPVVDGYYIVSPGKDSEKMVGNFDPIREMEVASLENLEEMIQFETDSTGPKGVVYQIFAADANQRQLSFTLDEATFSAEVSSGSATCIYRISNEEVEAIAEAKRQERISFAWNQLQANWNGYGLPASMMPTMAKAEIEALVGQDIDTVAAACKTLGDCLYYYALSGFEGSSGDLTVYDVDAGVGGLYWHFNYGPQETFARNEGNCGASSGLTSYLLQGDYETVGMLGMTFVAGAGGGHFINYLCDGTSSYVFDIVNLLSWFSQDGFYFSSGETLRSAADMWIEQSGYPVRLMWAHQSFDGDVPVGWDNSNISYLPKEWKDKGKILIETPEEGYVYRWCTISEGVQKKIQQMRNGED